MFGAQQPQKRTATGAAGAAGGTTTTTTPGFGFTGFSGATAATATPGAAAPTAFPTLSLGGSTPPAQQQQQQQQQPLFGAPAGTAAPATATTTPLFGGAAATTATTATPGATAPSLFGAKATGAAPATATPLFGGAAAAGMATPAGGSGFGFQPKASTAGGLSLGGATPAAAAGAAAGGIQSLDAIVKTTRYGELPEAVRGELDKMEKFIQKQISLAEEIQTNRADELILRVREQAQDAELKYQGLKNILDRDASLIKHLRSTVSREMKNADMATRFIDAYQNPNPSNYPFRNQDYFSYFVDVTNQLESKLQLYRQTIDDLERHLQGITQRVQYTPQSIVTIMRHQHESFLAIASKIAAVHDAVQKEKENFLHFRRRYFGETRNPFVANAGGNTYGSYTPLSVVASALKPSVDLSQQQQQQQQPAAGGFGSGAFGGGFGSTAGKSTGAFGTGAFGTAGAGATPSLFGGASTQPGAAKTGGGLFGAAATPAPAAGGGLFGQPAAGGGLFGAPQQPAAGGGGGLFGGAATPAGQQPAGGTGLFGGGAPAATAPAFGGGATSFGSSKRR